MRRRRVPVALTLLPIAAILWACGDETLLGAPGCEDDTGIIVAQSVPGAALIPCWEELPGGWTVGAVDIGDGGTTVELDSDRAGSGAATFEYRRSCDVAGLGRMASERDDVAVYESIRALSGGLDADRFFVFGGGCVKATFSFEEFDDLTHAEALVETLNFVSRADVNDLLRRRGEDFLLV